MMRAWARRARELHGELTAIAEPDPRWWLLAAGAAVTEPLAGAGYVASDAEPSADTFIGHVVPAPVDPIADAIARARAARTVIRELDGQLPDQPLAVTIRRGALGAQLVPSLLDVAAFAIGDRVVVAHLDDPDLEAKLRRGAIERSLAVPFVTVTIGDEPLATARHGHRRGWTRRGTNGTTEDVGPWLGLSRSGELALVSTCHMVVDGYGHAWLAAKIAEASGVRHHASGVTIPAPAPVVDAAPLDIAWRELERAPRALPLAYALGRALHRAAGRPSARFSPTFQIPVAPGALSDPDRRLRRVIPAIVSVRFDDGMAEPFEAFEARAGELIEREARGYGLTSRLLNAVRGAPAPLAWKRRAVGTTRPRWLAAIADVLGGRGCVSRIRLARPSPPACAASSPARLPGGYVVTVVDDGTRAAITVCGSSGSAALLDELVQGI